MKAYPLRFIAVSLLLSGASLHAASSRPKIGLALGGGGARGCAHIGVIRTLNELHIPIDYIAGTSMGAVVGGLYASGMTADEIEKAVLQADWSDVLNDRTAYRDLSFRRKEDDNRYLTALHAGLKSRRVVFPAGLRSGQKLRSLMQAYLLPAATVHDFSRLPIPFRAVATDIETGRAVVLDHGDLAEAIRASIAIPGYFSPVEIEGQLLVDGGLADNMPVDIVRSMGADIVIAVDVGSPLLKHEQIASLFGVTSQVLTFLTRKNVDEAIRGADAVLTPPVSSFALLGFESSAMIIAIARGYTLQQSAMLEPLRVSDSVYADAQRARNQLDQSQHPRHLREAQ